MELKNRISAFFFITILLMSTASTGQKRHEAGKPVTIQVIQFHLEQRCITCRKIEVLTRETLTKDFRNIHFSLVNVEDKKNEKLVGQFEAAGTALFLFNPKNGKQKNLTEFAFLTAGNQEKFEKELKKQIETFSKS